MNDRNEINAPAPPGLISSITEGFNAVASHVYLILPPMLLDLFLWFGPRLRLKTLLEPWLDRYLALMNSVLGAEAAEMLAGMEELWQFFFEQFNLLSILRTFPVGLPSLLYNAGAGETPLGTPPGLEIGSFWALVLLIGAAILLGVLAGAYYFFKIANSTRPTGERLSFRLVAWQTLQSLALMGILLILFMLIAVPASMLISVFGWFSPGLAQFAFFGLIVVLFWFLVPLLFSAHGIFAQRQNVFQSILTSVRMVRFYLPNTSLFFLTLLLLGVGLDQLWRIPPASSWMTLVGIFGHAFVYTGILAASFAYYQGGLRWMQAASRQRQSLMRA